MVYITGDTHGQFSAIRFFCKQNDTNTDDTMIILGDAGLNYYLGPKDLHLKNFVKNIPITLFCIRGNHEERPENIATYKTKQYWGGTVYYEEDFPNILFAKDGEEYFIGKKKCLVLGGAYSVDKHYRLMRGFKWFESEQLTKSEMEEIFNNINGKEYDFVFTHTCPYDTRPIHLFLNGIDQSTVDNSMEEWLQKVSESIIFHKWFFGHYHGEWTNGKYEMLFTNIKKLI